MHAWTHASHVRIGFQEDWSNLGSLTKFDSNPDSTYELGISYNGLPADEKARVGPEGRVGSLAVSVT
jgi:hypothetical protein